MRILIITDSLGLPRKEVNYRDVWTDQVLKTITNIGEKEIIVYTIHKRSLTIKQVWNMRADIGFICPDIIIFQFGIVDCARRALPEGMQNMVGKLPLKLRGGGAEFFK